MSDIKGIELEKLKEIISRTDKSGNEKVLLMLDFIYLREQQTIDKLNKEVDRWENEFNLQIGWLDVERKKNAKLTKEVDIQKRFKELARKLAFDRFEEITKLKEEIEGLEKLASDRLIELSKNSNAWSKENTKLKEDNLRIQTDSYHNECNLFISEGMVKDLNQLATDRGNEVHKLKEGLNDIKSQLFDVNNCDTILTSAIEQILKNK